MLKVCIGHYNCLHLISAKTGFICCQNSHDSVANVEWFAANFQFFDNLFAFLGLDFVDGTLKFCQQIPASLVMIKALICAKWYHLDWNNGITGHSAGSSWFGGMRIMQDEDHARWGFFLSLHAIQLAQLNVKFIFQSVT